LAHESMTPAQRVARGKLAAAARWHKTKTPPVAGASRWYGLVALPADYVWKGVAHASKILDAAEAVPELINLETEPSKPARCWSEDRKEVVARSREEDLRDRVPLVIEHDWDPRALPPITWEYAPDMEAMKRLLRVGAGGKS
ncbi:MAG: hypothetical protein NTW28_33050, partial [Candidatus Solibacter sp.]|nr:hypothetical protein [Candidatus Solibacter sp.]